MAIVASNFAAFMQCPNLKSIIHVPAYLVDVGFASKLRLVDVTK